MSAVVVLILRIIMVISLYAFLLTSLIVMWRKINYTARINEKEQIPLIRIEMDEPEQSAAFDQPEILIGRDEPNDLIIDDETVSGIHARIIFKNNQWMIEDLHSTNGTFMNNERIMSNTILVTQDVIMVGKRQFTVFIE